MDNYTELPHNQLILNTGGTHTGIIFCPFDDTCPSDYTAEQVCSNHASAPHRASISSGGSGWIARPDTGGTGFSKEAAPIGEPWIMLFFAGLFAIWQMIHRRRILSTILLALLTAAPLSAGITALSFSPATVGKATTIVPTVASVPEGRVALCWNLYHDAACEHEVTGTTFHSASKTAKNAVWLEAPATEGTYYIQCAIHTGSVCGGLLESSYVYPLHVYPADADIVLEREAQASASLVDITDDDTKQAYGAMRFSRTALNNEALSEYERYNYFISFPFDVKMADIYGIGEVGIDWRILYYDGKGRAEEGFFAERTDNWVMIDDTDSVLHAGQGYLLQLNAIQMAADNEAIWTDGADIATLYFPAISTISRLETEEVTLPALGSDYACTIDLSATLGAEGDRRTKDSYWRCIGVPSFTSPAGVEGLTYLYAWNKNDNSLSVVSSAGFAFKPMQAYLIQNGDAITWQDVTKPASIVARHQETSFEEIPIELLHNEALCDRTFVRLTDDTRVTNDFDFGRDLIKELNADKANIYTMVGYERLAANCLPTSEQTILVPVGVQIEEEGTYTFAMPEGSHDFSIVLVDNLTNTRTNLSQTDYSITLASGQHDARFALEIGETQDTPSAIETNSPMRASEMHKVMLNGQLYIVWGEKVYSILGLLFPRPVLCGTPQSPSW